MNVRTIKYICLAVSGLLTSACGTELEEGVTPFSEMMDVAEQVSFTADDTQKTLSVSADCQWTASLSQAWEGLTVSPLSGDGDQTLTIQTPANTQRSSRQATLTLTTKGGIVKTVGLTQSLGNVSLTVTGGQDGTLSFGVSGGEQHFSITSNTSWTITGQASWLSLDRTEGQGNQKVLVTVSETQTDEVRQATLTVTADGVTRPATVVVTQQAKDISITVSPTTLTAIATGETKTVTIACNADWTVSASAEWVSLSASSGAQTDTQLSISCQPNPGAERTATIVFRSGTKAETNVTLTQQGGTLPEVTKPSTDGATITKYGIGPLTFSFSSAFEVTEVGLCYSTTRELPTTADDHVSQSVSTTKGNASLSITGLSSRTTYYVRAYAVSTVGTAYSQQAVTFTTQGGLPNEDDNQMPNPR